MPLMKFIISAVNDSRLEPVSTRLGQLAEVVDELREILTSVRTDCDPAVFYNRIRVWFPGGRVIYDLEDGESIEEEWAGSSAAQSSIIQALDALLGIEPLSHKPQDKYDVQPSDRSKMAFLVRMRLYIPADHRAFLEDLSRFGQCMRVSILDHPDRKQAVGTMEAYNRVIDTMRKFRKAEEGRKVWRDWRDQRCTVSEEYSGPDRQWEDGVMCFEVTVHWISRYTTCAA